MQLPASLLPQPKKTFSVYLPDGKQIYKEGIFYHCVTHGKMQHANNSNTLGRGCDCCRNSFTMIAKRRNEQSDKCYRYECRPCDMDLCMNCIEGQSMWKTE